MLLLPLNNLLVIALIFKFFASEMVTKISEMYWIWSINRLSVPGPLQPCLSLLPWLAFLLFLSLSVASAKPDCPMQAVLPPALQLWSHWLSLLKCLFFFSTYLYCNSRIYLFLPVLGLRCCTRAFSSCGERGLLLIAVRGLLIAVASLVVEHGL